MNHDFTMTTLASQTTARPLPPDVCALRDHVGVPEPHAVRVRRASSAWLYQLAARIDPRPARNERDELFDAISALLAEPRPLETVSQRGC